MSINYHPDFPGKRYIVDALLSKDAPVNVYAGNNRKAAVKSANFWDEKADTFFYDLALDQYKGFGAPILRPIYGADVSANLKAAERYLEAKLNESVARALSRI